MSAVDDDGIATTGGAGGLAADLDAMTGAAVVLATVSGDLSELAARLTAAMAEPDLLAAAALDPAGAARVSQDVLTVLGGPAGLPAVAVRLGALATSVHAAARLYACTERAQADLLRHLRDAGAHAAGTAVNVAVSRFSHVTLAATAVVAGGWVAYRGLPLVWNEAELVAVDVALGRFEWGSLDDRYLRLGTHHVVLLHRDVQSAPGAVKGWLAEHPDVAQQGVGGLPAFLDGLTGPLVVPAVLEDGGLGLAWPPDDVTELAGLVTALSAVSPLFARGRVEVERVPAPRAPAPSGPAPGPGVQGALQRLVPSPAAPGRIRVERIERSGRVSWAVYVPPTQVWSFGSGPNPYDGSTNVRSIGGRETAAADAVTVALRSAGAEAGEPVMLAGYSQGGLTAAKLAADDTFRDDFTVTTVLTAGSPVGVFDIPPEVQVLSLEHEADLVPVLDGRPNPAGENWTTVRRDLDDVGPDPATAHQLESYLEAAEAVDASTDDSVVAWRDAADPFLDTTDAEVEVTEWRARRVGDDE